MNKNRNPFRVLKNSTRGKNGQWKTKDKREKLRELGCGKWVSKGRVGIGGGESATED